MCIATNRQHQCYGVEMGSTNSTGRSRKRQRQDTKETKPAVVGLPSAVFSSSTVNPALFYNSPNNNLLSTSDWQSRVHQQTHPNTQTQTQIPQTPTPTQTQIPQAPQSSTQIPQLSLQQLLQLPTTPSIQIPQTPGGNGTALVQQPHQMMVYPRSFGSQVIL